MARRNVYLPDELEAQVAARRPDLNVSRVLQDALWGLLGDDCEHRRLSCEDCGRELHRGDLGGAAVADYYRELLHELGPLVDQGGTAEGAARIAKRVAIEAGVPDAEHRALPRPPRTARNSRVLI